MKIKEKEAVSPVIGVILMVAITVVLAAVLYVWVSGFMGVAPPGVTTLAMSGWTQAPGTYNISASPISTSPAAGIKWSDTTWQLYNRTSATVVTPAYDFSHTDVDDDGFLEAGDTVSVGAPEPGIYNVRVIVGGSQIYESPQINIV